jgi:hypothetical protein
MRESTPCSLFSLPSASDGLNLTISRSSSIRSGMGLFYAISCRASSWRRYAAFFRRAAPIRVRRRAGQIRLNQVPIDAAWTLVAPQKPAEKIRDLDRFAVEAKPGEPATPTVKEERIERQQIAVASLEDNAIQFYQSAKVVGERTKATLAEIVKRKREFQQVAASRQQREQRIRQIGEDQNRARQNMDRLDHASKLYKSRIKKLITQEEKVVKLNEEIASLTEPPANCEESAPGPRRHRGKMATSHSFGNGNFPYGRGV